MKMSLKMKNRSHRYDRVCLTCLRALIFTRLNYALGAPYSRYKISY